MLALLHKLYRIQLLTFRGMFYLLQALFSQGTNLMALVGLMARLCPQQVALVDEQERLTYQELEIEIQQLIQIIYTTKKLQKGQKVGLMATNQAVWVKILVALSRLGVHVYLLNPDMSQQQWQQLQKKVAFDALILDKYANSALHESEPSYAIIQADLLQQWAKTPIAKKIKIARANRSNLVILTGGTTGDYKLAARKPSIFTFLNPFCALLTKLHLDNYRSIYVATPIYHGFGLSSIIIALVLGAKIVLSPRFDAVEVGNKIQAEQVEVVTVVPVMLQRLLNQVPQQLDSLQVILTGGAALSPSLAQQTTTQLGHKLANLYGTSEAGFSVMATSQDLATYSASIGKPIGGVQTSIRDKKNNELPQGSVGILHLKSKWTMSNKSSAWISTGDLAYANAEGYYFLCGRCDDMIVSGGENVYPIELENLMAQHPAVQAVAAVGIPDAEFGQRLSVHLVLHQGATLTEIELKKWLQKNAARHQQPKRIVFHTELPYTAIGKIDKRGLSMLDC